MKGLWRFAQTVLGIIFRHPVTGVSIIPILPDGQIVLMQRRDNGRWGVPGGFVDWGETIATTVKRELKEETGLDLVEISQLVGVYSAPDRDPRVHSICIVVEACVEGNLHISDPLEVLALQAFTRETLPKELTHDHAEQLENYFQGGTTVA
ncbi:MAG: NUDIX hydrolase [Aphanocapsa sp. GSE-SYN-MK-11-07L]|jgi:8-oxo-dGTP diphosphatase|nr:NUDIX hydrolase [Aphanocapsa sp. GSE-SYN-MK-11-07L]